MGLGARMDTIEKWVQHFEESAREKAQLYADIRRVAKEYGVPFKQLRQRYLRLCPDGRFNANTLWAIGELERQAELLAEKSPPPGK